MKNADLFMSIHTNAVPKKEKANEVDGIETFFLSPARKKKKKELQHLKINQILEKWVILQKMYFRVIKSTRITASHKFAIDVQAGFTIS